MKLDLPVLLVLLTLAAAAQTLLPGMPGSLLKIPFLSGVVVYYALNRPLVMSLVAAVWAGWLTDSGGGLPVFCTGAFLLLLVLVLQPLRRFLDGSFVGVVAVATGVALLQALWQLSWAHLALPGSAWRVAGDFVLLLPAGVLAGAVAYGVGHTLDRFAGNVKEREELQGQRL
ncbi:MAG: hypothetical protein WCR06_04935 [bacterium]